jgi:chromate transporter
MRPASRSTEVLAAFFRLGCTSFGGPVAHLGYFRTEFVTRRRWLGEAEFADLLALCQFLPGPASSQLGMALGLLRAGPAGMLAAWVGFTLPSAAIMIACAYGLGALGDPGQAAWLKGLKLVAVAVVAQAVWGMARSLCPDRLRASIAVAATLLVLAVPTSLGQIVGIAFGALCGLALPGGAAPADGHVPMAVRIPRPVALASLGLFLALLVLLLLVLLLPGARNPVLAIFAAFYRAGALVFGGGHVVLPLLQALVVRPGWIGDSAFLAGYGAAQAVPGPLFTFAAFLGAAMPFGPGGWRGGLLALVAIFLPSFLLVAGVLPFWDGLRRRARVQAALRGVNAAVVGLLLAALFTPVWTGAVATPADFALVVLAFLLLAGWSVAPWLVVLLGAGAGTALGAAGIPL